MPSRPCLERGLEVLGGGGGHETFDAIDAPRLDLLLEATGHPVEGQALPEQTQSTEQHGRESQARTSHLHSPADPRSGDESKDDGKQRKHRAARQRHSTDRADDRRDRELAQRSVGIVGGFHRLQTLPGETIRTLRPWRHLRLRTGASR